MYSKLSKGLLAIALGGLTAVSFAQEDWDQPSTLGSYRPVASGVNTWSNYYQDTAPGPINRDASSPVQNPVPQNSRIGNVAKPSSTASSSMYSQDCGPCGPGSTLNGYGASSSGCGNGYQNGCGPSGYFLGGSDCNSGDSGKRSQFGSRLFKSQDSCIDGEVQCGNGNSNFVAGVSALVFRRDYEDDRGMSYNSAGQYLFSTDADVDSMGGFEAYLGKRGCSGNGWEASFWSLNPSRSDVSIGSNPYTSLGGLTDIYHVPSSSSVLNIYNNADTHRLYRTNDISNLQFNVLRNGGTFSGGRSSYELLGGFRWFQFDEDMRYAAFSSYSGHPVQFNYDTNVQNTMLGGQFGGRMERCLTGRLRFATSMTLGLFSNSICQSQRMYDADTGTDALINAGPFNGRPYNYTSRKTDISMLGEMNVGGYFMLSQSVRVSLGYRALGVSGIAFSPNQIPYNFTDGADIQRIDSNGSLLLHGAYFGLQKCF